jgi:acetaldehyde dehydrogenase (acetylating)
VLCSTEASVIVDSSIKNIVIDEFKKHNCYFVEGDEKAKLSGLMFDSRGDLNPDIVGKPATYIAQKAGISVPATTKVLIVELQGVGRDYPLSHEKLSPVLSFFTVDNWREGCERCIELLEFGGIGHTMAIHSMDEDIVMKFALEKPAFRILVNTVGALGAVGYTNELLPSLTLGPGTFGGSIISENVSAKHLFNVKRLAFETRPLNPAAGVEFKTEPVLSKPEIKTSSNYNARQETHKTSPQKSWIEEIEERIRLKAANAPEPLHKPKQPVDQIPQENKGDALGSGISEEEVNKIIQEFSKR